MDMTELVKILINNTGLNLKAFSQKADLPYSTLRSMLERGLGNASINNVLKVCKTLGITVEQLQEMAKNDSLVPLDKKEEEKKNPIETLAAHFDGDEFTEEDLDDIENFIKYVKSKRENK